VRTHPYVLTSSHDESKQWPVAISQQQAQGERPPALQTPDILTLDLADKSTVVTPSIPGQHLVGPDVRIKLATSGQAYVAGQTLEQVWDAVLRHLSRFLDEPQIALDVFAYDRKSVVGRQRPRTTGSFLATG
jgi:hypothetical protein